MRNLRLIRHRGIPLGAMKRAPIDTAWFLARLEEQGYSIRALALKMKNREGKPMDQAGLTHLLNGTGNGPRAREMTVRELDQLVEILELDPLEAFDRARGRR